MQQTTKWFAVVTDSSLFKDYEIREGKMALWELICCLQYSWFPVWKGAQLRRVFVCLLRLQQQQRHYSCSMAHFPTSACFSPVAFRCAQISPSLSPLSFLPPATHFHHSMPRVFSHPPPCPMGLMFLPCLPFPCPSPPLLPLCPLFYNHLSSLSHIVCDHFVICGQPVAASCG